MTGPRRPTPETFQDAAGDWRWRIVAGNGRKVASSGESFATKANAERALAGLLRATLEWAFADMAAEMAEGVPV